MSDVFTIRNDEIGRALRAFDPGVERTGPAAWQAVIYNGAPLPVTAWIEQEWLRLDAPLAAFAGEKNVAKILSWNARLGGLAKFAVAAQLRALHLRAEIPCPIYGGMSGDLERRLGDTGGGFRTASAMLHGKPHAQTPSDSPWDSPSDSPSDSVAAAACDPAALCRAAGWAATERTGAAVVELDAGAQAVVEPRAGGVLVRSELARTARYSDISREALCLLLLTASGIVRMARPAAVDEAANDEISETGKAILSGVRLEVGFSSEPSPEELSSALSAIGVASRLFRREAEVLQIEEVARRYLASQTSDRLLRAASSPHSSNGGQ